MTNKELFDKLSTKNTFRYPAQLDDRKLNVNLSDMFSRFIKDAARCNGYNSDIFYDMLFINNLVNDFGESAVNEPIWVGFRKLGVDGTAFVLSRLDDQHVYTSLSANYFALYSVVIEHDEGDWYNIYLCEYGV